MSRFLLIAFLVSTSAWAIDPTEEAIILNQEMQFLEEAAKVGPTISTISPDSENTLSPAINDDSLERQYFGSDEDSVQTRTAAPTRKARSL